MASFHTKFALLIFNTYSCLVQATITIFLNVQVRCKTSLILIFLFENMAKVQTFLHTFCWLIKSAMFCIFHFIPRMFCFFTQHFPSLAGCVVVGQNVWGQLVQQHWQVASVSRNPISNIQVFTFATRGKGKCVT